MKKIKQEKGITLTALVITIILILILTGTTVFDVRRSVRIRTLTNLINDIELLNDKVADYYNEYGEIPAKIKYTNLDELRNTNIFSKSDLEDDNGEFYVIDLEAMQGISLNYGRDYDKIKTETQNVTETKTDTASTLEASTTDIANKYKDVYIINKNTHNIFYVRGITIKRNGEKTTYYTDYRTPDNTEVDLRYIDGILIPNEIKKKDNSETEITIQPKYYYIGKITDSSGNESIVISTNKDDSIDEQNENQYKWIKNISRMSRIPDSIELNENQTEEDFIKSVNKWNGYFRNMRDERKVIY